VDGGCEDGGGSAAVHGDEAATWMRVFSQDDRFLLRGVSITYLDATGVRISEA